MTLYYCHMAMSNNDSMKENVKDGMCVTQKRQARLLYTGPSTNMTSSQRLLQELLRAVICLVVDMNIGTLDIR